MAETWPNTFGRRLFLKIADGIGRTIVKPFRRGREIGVESVGRILVVEPWNIGDVVLTTPFLRALRQRFPRARVSLLAKPHARVILEGTRLVDEFIDADLPWTASRGKYPLSRDAVGRMRRLLRELRSRRFDLTVDARVDIRSNALTALAGAPHRAGFETGGGGWLLTRWIAADMRRTHKVDDWLALLGATPGPPSSNQYDRRPSLVVTEQERDAALRRLSLAGSIHRPVIGYHPGGSHPGKRWPLDRYEQLIERLNESIGGTHVVFLGPDDAAPKRLPTDSVVRRTTLREMMAEIACCNVLVCNDSGPMHLADALGIPVIAIFEVGNPRWYGPSGERAIVIEGEMADRGVSAAPLDNPPSNPVKVERVFQAVNTVVGPASARHDLDTTRVR